MRVITVLFLSLIATLTFAKAVRANLDTLVLESTVIAQGTVSKVSRINGIACKPSNDCLLAHVTPKKVLKGQEFVGDEVAVVFDPEVEISAFFKEGEEVVLFLQPWKGQFGVTRGYVGKVLVKSSKADTSQIIGQRDTQDASRFTQQIQKLVTHGKQSPVSNTGRESFMRERQP